MRLLSLVALLLAPLARGHPSDTATLTVHYGPKTLAFQVPQLDPAAPPDYEFARSRDMGVRMHAAVETARQEIINMVHVDAAGSFGALADALGNPPFANETSWAQFVHSVRAERTLWPRVDRRAPFLPQVFASNSITDQAGVFNMQAVHAYKEGSKTVALQYMQQVVAWVRPFVKGNERAAVYASNYAALLVDAYEAMLPLPPAERMRSPWELLLEAKEVVTAAITELQLPEVPRLNALMGYINEQLGQVSSAVASYVTALQAAGHTDLAFSGALYNRLLNLEGPRLDVVLIHTKFPFLLHTLDSRIDTKMSFGMISYRFWDPPATQVFGIAASTCGKDSVVLDVGGNVGYFALLAASLGCQVLAIEPLPRLAALLEQNIALNNMQDRVTLLQAAVASGGVASTTTRLLSRDGAASGSHTGPDALLSRPASKADDINVTMSYMPYGCIACSHVDVDLDRRNRRASERGSPSSPATPNTAPDVLTETETVVVPAIRLDHALAHLVPTMQPTCFPDPSEPAGMRCGLHVPLVKLDIEGCETDALTTLLPALSPDTLLEPPHFVIEVCPGGWGRCGTDLASAVRVYAELARMGYTFIAFEVTSEARELLPNLSSLSSPVSLPPAGMHDLLELHINGEEDVRALLEPQMVSLFACMQLWLRPPASTKQ